MKTITPSELLTELIVAYDLLNEAYWLALRQLNQGGVSVSDQWSFWNAFQALDELRGFGGALGESAADHRRDAKDGRPDADDNPFYVRADELRDILQPEPVDPVIA